MIHEIINKDYSALFSQSSGENKEQKKFPFSDEEVQTLWEHKEFPFCDLVLVALYTGLRAKELLLLENSNIDLDNDTMVGGMKTTAGTNRMVPIHPLIKYIIIDHYNIDNQYLFLNERSESMSYDQYLGRFKKIMGFFHMKHSPHETRHTFITKAKEVGIDDNVIKLIVSHEIRDITEKVYTHRNVDELKSEI